jgi:hypothetical protein
MRSELRMKRMEAVFTALPLLLFGPKLADAHSGHGMPGTSHWHATDTAGLLLVVLLAGAAWWLSRRK